MVEIENFHYPHVLKKIDLCKFCHLGMQTLLMNGEAKLRCVFVFFCFLNGFK